MPPFRSGALALLRALTVIAKADALECQSNDLFYSSLARQFPGELISDTILFAASQSKNLTSAAPYFARDAGANACSTTMPSR